MFMPLRPRRPAPPRGFTMIEILIVIAIIVILAALLFPVIRSAQIAAQNAKVAAEITQLGLAIDQFKNDHGCFPPSRIRLREALPYKLNSGHDDFEFDRHSVEYLRRAFGDAIDLPIDTTTTGSGNGTALTANQWVWFKDSAAGAANDTARDYDLEGDECLVFFLGGIAEFLGNDASGRPQFALHGFSKNPANPSGIPQSGGANTARTAPLYNFDPRRLFVRVDFPSLTAIDAAAGTPAHDFDAAARPANKMPSYNAMSNVTSLEEYRPIAYFSSYEGRGYRPHDVNYGGTTADPENDIFFQMTWPFVTDGPTDNHAESRGPNPYILTESPTAADVVPLTYIKPFKENGYQIIHPGSDGIYGIGGQLGGQRELNDDPGALDNITNFSDGKTLNEFQKTLQSN